MDVALARGPPLRLPPCLPPCLLPCLLLSRSLRRARQGPPSADYQEVSFWFAIAESASGDFGEFSPPSTSRIAPVM